MGIYYQKLGDEREAFSYLNQALDAGVDQTLFVFSMMYLDMFMSGKSFDLVEFERILAIAKEKGEAQAVFIMTNLSRELGIESDDSDVASDSPPEEEVTEFSEEEAEERPPVLDVEKALPTEPLKVRFKKSKAEKTPPKSEKAAVSPKMPRPVRKVQEDLGAGARSVSKDAFRSLLEAIKEDGGEVKSGSGSRISVKWNGTSFGMHIPHGKDRGAIRGDRLRDLQRFLTEAGT